MQMVEIGEIPMNQGSLTIYRHIISNIVFEKYRGNPNDLHSSRGLHTGLCCHTNQNKL